MVNILCAVAVLAGAPADDSEPKKVATAYLKAIAGQGDTAGRDLLLGGLTMNAQLFSLDNWEFKSKDPVQKEEGDLSAAMRLVKDLDHAGREALTKMLQTEEPATDFKVHQISADEASKLTQPTREGAAKLLSAHPVLAYALRVGKEVFWHPKNPMRLTLEKSGGAGTYALEVHRWQVLSREGPNKNPREWPLRVVRFRAGKFDTGWKVLPASDWNAE